LPSWAPNTAWRQATRSTLSTCCSTIRVIVEYALREATKPIGVATYRIVKRLPAELRAELPDPKQIAGLLAGLE
jgi:hypothetical protein